MTGTFVTGTDTGIGKTVVSSLLVAALRRFGPVGYWKPVQTGIEQDDDAREVRRLARCTAEEMGAGGIRLARPLSPHLSARLAGRSLSVALLLTLAGRLPAGRQWIVEGAGGVLVPLNAQETLADLMADLGLATVVTARSGLGTINHTLLTISELRRRSVPLAGVVMVGEPNAENRKAIERHGRTEVLAEVPVLRPLDAASVGGLAKSLAGRFRPLVKHHRTGGQRIMKI